MNERIPYPDCVFAVTLIAHHRPARFPYRLLLSPCTGLCIRRPAGRADAFESV